MATSLDDAPLPAAAPSMGLSLDTSEVVDAGVPAPVPDPAAASGFFFLRVRRLAAAGALVVGAAVAFFFLPPPPDIVKHSTMMPGGERGGEGAYECAQRCG